MKKLFFRFITKYNLIQQFVIFLLLYAASLVLYAKFLELYFDQFSFSQIINWLLGAYVPDKTNALLNMDIPYGKAAFISFTSVIILVWQSVLIAKLLNRPDYIRLSDVITYYPSDAHDKDNDFIVFRLNNEGYDSLYNVEVSATLRFFDEQSQTIQHYSCSLRNPRIPVLSPNMPFRIYIECSPIETAIRQLVLDPSGKRSGEGKTFVTYQDEIDFYHQNKITRSELVVFISGYDIALEQEKSVSMSYLLREMKYGAFESINPDVGPDGLSRFDKHEIHRRYNAVENEGCWPA